MLYLKERNGCKEKFTERVLKKTLYKFSENSEKNIDITLSALYHNDKIFLRRKT